MIKYFRRIRFDLIEKNKITKYLKYAIGEIVLVVIGILIALSVNNWNQEKKDRKSAEDYLERIHRDLVQDTINFKKNIIRNNELRQDIKQLLTSLYAGVETIEQVQAMSIVYDQALDQVFRPNDNTYVGMVNSGALGLITNSELKDKIVDLYSEYDQNKDLLSSINEWMISIATTLDTSTDFLKFGIGVSDIFTTPEMLNENDFSFLNNKEDPKFKLLVRAISATAFNQNVHNAYYKELISRCGTVLKLIDSELEK